MTAISGRVRVKVVSNDFPRVRAEMHANATTFVAKAAHDIEAGAKAEIRRLDLIDTGNMLNSVHAVQVGPMLWRIVVGALYGIYHEFGTRFMAARPFFFHVADQVGAQFKAAMRSLVGR